MSVGYGACAILEELDETMLIYKYICYNANLPNHNEAIESFDGVIYISREVLVEPIIYQKIKKMHNKKRKLIEKRIHQSVDFDELIKDKTITIFNSIYTWETNDNNIDIMALRLLYKLFDEYQATSAIPNVISIDC